MAEFLKDDTLDIHGHLSKQDVYQLLVKECKKRMEDKPYIEQEKKLYCVMRKPAVYLIYRRNSCSVSF